MDDNKKSVGLLMVNLTHLHKTTKVGCGCIIMARVPAMVDDCQPGSSGLVQWLCAKSMKHPCVVNTNMFAKPCCPLFNALPQRWVM